MAILTTDLLWKLSVTTGSAGDSTAQGTVDNSLGKYISTTQITDASLHNLFDKVTGAENTAGDVEYRCVFVHNNHGSLTLENPVVWLSDTITGGAAVAIGLDPAGVTAKGSASAQAAEIADESTAPVGVTFSSPTSKATGLSLANIPAGSVAAVWVRRTAADSAALAIDGATLKLEGDTAA